MARLLFLVHRLPYPPNKGDKVRSYHLLRYLASRHEVHLGTFVDDPEDLAHLDAVRSMCATVFAPRLHSSLARVLSLRALLTGEPLTLPYYRHPGLARWVADLHAQRAVDQTLIFSSSMAQYAQAGPGHPGFLVDFVDVDSAKWSAYARQRSWPLSWLYAREGRSLLAYERAVAQDARQSFFATDKEAALFRQLAPESAARVGDLGNGVDAGYFEPQPDRPSPFQPGEHPLVFTGAMDYWPNIDAVVWFANEVLPRLRVRWPQLRLYIVGRRPAAAVTALATESVKVTGTVPDVRPYLQHSAVVVAPLRLARGVQNKVLEAMAMARPVVASTTCAQAIEAQVGAELLAAESAEDHVAAIETLLQDRALADRIGQAARACVLRSYDWDARLQPLDAYLGATHPLDRQP